ncbi:MAG TPA: hypothetical protein VFP25_05090 [Nitrososphaeraceae archaeon]|nr:hypothetical protein [Nitrososphaeraceae archaeon]
MPVLVSEPKLFDHGRRLTYYQSPKRPLEKEKRRREEKKIRKK